MPKKKMVKAIKKSIAKKVVAKAALTKKTAPNAKAKKSSSSAKKPSAAAKPAVKAVKKSAPTKAPAPSSATPEISLGRPLVTQEEKLYMLFHDDYLARQVFEFLRVDTIKELEQFSQQQIIHLMSKPLRMTLDRIRQRLAEFKRSLKDDEQFAANFLSRQP